MAKPAVLVAGLAVSHERGMVALYDARLSYTVRCYVASLALIKGAGMAEFNARLSRSKRPIPLWADAFQRDTQHLEADEVGAYFSIIMAMWSRETCDFPDDERKLARVSRVSRRLWVSRIWPSLSEFFCVENGVIFQRRLRREAAYTERQVTQQSIRKKGEQRDKALINNDPIPSVDVSVDEPTQQPTYLQPTDSVPNGTADESIDFTKEVFDRGVAFLGRYDIPKQRARALIGKWRKDAGETETFNALRDASRAGITEPVAWITARLKPSADISDIFAKRRAENAT